MVELSDGENMCNRLDTIPACDRRMDRRTSCDGIVRAMHTRRAVKNEVATVIETIYYNEPSHLLDFVDD